MYHYQEIPVPHIFSVVSWDLTVFPSSFGFPTLPFAEISYPIYKYSMSDGVSAVYHIASITRKSVGMAWTPAWGTAVGQV